MARNMYTIHSVTTITTFKNNIISVFLGSVYFDSILGKLYESVTKRGTQKWDIYIIKNIYVMKI